MKYQGHKLCLRSDGRWQVKYTINKKSLYIYDRNQKKCYDKLKLVLKNKTFTAINIRKGISLFEWIDEWKLTYKKSKLKASSYRQIEIIIKNHIKQNMKDIKLIKLLPYDIDNLLNKIKSSRMKKYSYDTIRECLKDAFKNKLIKEDISININQVKHNREEGRALTIEERKILMSNYDKVKYGEIFPFYLFSGCRKSELLNLNYSMIDIVNKTILIPGTKTENSKRILPLFNNLEKIINYYEIPINKNLQLFPISESTLKRKTFELSNICGFKINIKDLRTTFGTMCAENGIAEKVIAKWMGHTNEATTKKYYIKVLSNFEKEQITKFDTKFDTKF